MNNLKDKKALIIGASGGMGTAVASMLSKNGANCFLVGRRKDKPVDIFFMLYFILIPLFYLCL